MNKLRYAMILCACAIPAFASDWTNSGGNNGRNGIIDTLGPSSPDLLWTGGPTSLIAWHPVIEDRRVFVVRQTGFPPAGEPGGSTIYALDLDTGDVLWDVDLPFEPGDWTTWIAGVSQGRVYASRSGNGASVSAKMYALDAATGDQLWISEDETTAGAYDGVVFADDGDPVVADFRNITRIDAETGETVWRSDRSCSVSGNCGGAIFEDGMYVADAEPGGHVIVKYDLETGGLMYQSPLMPGFTLQNTPMAGPDGTIYLSRTQNNPATDFFYAFTDTGDGFSLKWLVPAGWSTRSEFAVSDDAVYILSRDDEILKLEPATGATLFTSEPGDFSGPRMAIDPIGRLYVSNGSFPTGRLFALNQNMSELWSVPVTNVNIGGPSIGPDGTLVVAGRGGDLRAYRQGGAPCLADVVEDGVLDFFDVQAFLTAFTDNAPLADFTGDGVYDFFDVQRFLDLFGGGCP